MADPDVKSRLVGLVLAAGGSARLGRSKQLLNWRGEPLICHVVRTLSVVCDGGVLVVVGADGAAVQQAISLCNLPRVRCLHNPAWASGMASSLTAGLSEIRKQSVDAALVAPGDLPLLSVDDLKALRTAWQQSPESPAAAGYDGTAGAPAIFPAAWFDALAGLTGDAGARSLLMDNESVNTVAMPSAALDIDTDEDVAMMQSRGRQEDSQ